MHGMHVGIAGQLTSDIAWLVGHHLYDIIFVYLLYCIVLQECK